MTVTVPATGPRTPRGIEEVEDVLLPLLRTQPPQGAGRPKDLTKRRHEADDVGAVRTVTPGVDMLLFLETDLPKERRIGIAVHHQKKLVDLAIQRLGPGSSCVSERQHVTRINATTQRLLLEDLTTLLERETAVGDDSNVGRFLQLVRHSRKSQVPAASVQNRQVGTGQIQDVILLVVGDGAEDLTDNILRGRGTSLSTTEALHNPLYMLGVLAALNAAFSLLQPIDTTHLDELPHTKCEAVTLDELRGARRKPDLRDVMDVDRADVVPPMDTNCQFLKRSG